ncbi:unnamed protein product, partial [marine sediment metagenome]
MKKLINKAVNSKLNLDFSIVKKARETAKTIALDTQKFIDKHTTTSIERTVCRLLGIDGVDEFGVPLPNVVVNNIKKDKGLGKGVAIFIGNAILQKRLSPQEIAEKISKDELDLTKLPMNDLSEIKITITKLTKQTLEKIINNKKKREAYLEKFGEKEGPLLYIIVATGNIYEDITQAKAAAKQGADIIAVIRSTGQSLLDYVPYGA